MSVVVIYWRELQQWDGKKKNSILSDPSWKAQKWGFHRCLNYTILSKWNQFNQGNSTATDNLEHTSVKLVNTSHPPHPYTPHPANGKPGAVTESPVRVWKKGNTLQIFPVECVKDSTWWSRSTGAAGYRKDETDECARVGLFFFFCLQIDALKISRTSTTKHSQAASHELTEIFLLFIFSKSSVVSSGLKTQQTFLLRCQSDIHDADRGRLLLPVHKRKRKKKDTALLPPSTRTVYTVVKA